MKEFLERTWQDIKQRKNLELYLILAAILAVFIADVLGVDTTNALVEITLATLAVLLYGMIDARHDSENQNQELAELKQSVHQLSSSSQDFLDNKWPTSLTQEMEMADELWLVGVSLLRTVKTNYALLENRLKYGYLVRVLVVHPEGIGVEIAVSRNYGRRDIEQKSTDIRRTLGDLCELRQKGSGRLEIRTTQHPLSYGAILVSPQSSAHGRIHVENYGYRVKSGGFPVFSLRPDHGDWYEFYKHELHLLWEDASQWNCENQS